MRFQRLHAPAFGPFTNLELEFPSEDHDLHLIYGENEAGKSSLLRAIRDLLFGIHSQSPDNFLHDYKELRLLGEIENKAGERLVFQRRKGTKNTLLDQNGSSLNEKALLPFLGSIDQAYFSAMFGLGSKELHEGAAQLLRGEGEIGNALFSASLGGTPIQRVLDALIEESGRLFKGRSTTNVTIRPAITLYKELLKKGRDSTVNPDTWDKLERDLAEQLKAKNSLDEEIAGFEREIAWISRCEDALPSVGLLNEEMKSLRELPAMPEFASDFVKRARAVRDAVSVSSRNVKVQAESIKLLEDQLAKCAISPSFLNESGSLDMLHQDLGAYREQKKSLTKLKENLAGIEPILQAGMKNLEVSSELDSLETLRLSSAAQLMSEEAANALRVALSNQIENKDKSEKLRTDIENDEKELNLLPETNLSSLREALAVAAEATDANKTLGMSQSAVEKLVLEVASQRALVPGIPEDLDAATSLSVPLPLTIRNFHGRFASLERENVAVQKLIRDEEDNVNALDDDLRRLERRRELPSEESLEQARKHRDHGWKLVLADWKGDGAKEDLEADAPLEVAFPQAIVRADKIADQLRNDAEAVAQAEEKRLQIQNSREKTQQANVTLTSLKTSMAECQAAWDSDWAPIGIQPRSPDEMSEWRENWVQLREIVRKLREAEATISSKKRQIQEARKILAAALNDSFEKPFSVLFEAARSRVQQGEESLGQRTAILRRLETLRKESETLDRKLAGFHQAVETANANWILACKTAGLPDQMSYETGLSLLRDRKELLRTFDSWKKLSSEAEATLRAIKQYEQIVREKAVALGIEADLTESQESGLWKALSQAREAQTMHDLLVSQIDEAKNELTKAKQAEKLALVAMEDLLRLCKLGDPEELEPLLANLEKQTKIKEQVDRLRETLSGLARGQDVDDFIARVQAENSDELPHRKTQLEKSKAEKKTALQTVHEVLIALKNEKDKLEQAGDAAADFRQQAESVAAKLKQDVSRFVRLRLAADLLQSQIERFRKENQGPLLEKSGQVFRQMTRQAFDGLAADFNEKDVPVLVGHRADESKVPVEGMSAGSRDQLYLALRLAAMDRYLEEYEPMPLILDDLLITFDNERTRAILPQLATLAKRTQVFLFTHHEHLVELCRETIGQGKFRLHQLGGDTSN